MKTSRWLLAVWLTGSLASSLAFAQQPPHGGDHGPGPGDHGGPGGPGQHHPHPGHGGTAGHPPMRPAPRATNRPAVSSKAIATGIVAIACRASTGTAST